MKNLMTTSESHGATNFKHGTADTITRIISSNWNC